MWRNTTGLAIKTKRRQLVNKMWNHCRTITDVDDWLLTFKFPGMAGYSVSVCAHREHRCVYIISYYSNSRVYFMNKLMKFLKILPSRYYRRTTVKSSVQLPHHNLCNSASIILYELYRMTNQHKMPPLICTTCALFYTNWQTLCLVQLQELTSQVQILNDSESFNGTNAFEMTDDDSSIKPGSKRHKLFSQ